MSRNNEVIKTLKEIPSTYLTKNGTLPWANILNKPATFPPSNHTHAYLPLAGGTLTNNISYNMHNSTQTPIYIYGGDANGQGISIGAGAATIISSGEGKNLIEANILATNEVMVVGSDNAIEFHTALQGGWDARKTMIMERDGTLVNNNGFVSGLNTGTYLAGNQGKALISSTANAGAYVMLNRYRSTNGYFTIGGYQGKYLMQYTAKDTVDEGTNVVTKAATLLDEGGNSYFPGTVNAGNLQVGGANVYTTSRKPSAADVGALASGGTAVNSSKLNSKTETTAATANTIATRDANADISVRLLRSNYANQSTISGAIAFRVNNTTDNYTRYCSSPSAVRTWIEAASTSHSHGLSDLSIGSVGKDLPRTTNLNTIYVSGWHSWSGACTGSPSDYGVVLTLIWGNAGDAYADRYQIAMTSTHLTYCRDYVNRAWTSWRSL